MNFTTTDPEESGQITPNPIGADNSISRQTDSHGDVTFEYVENVVSDGSVFLLKGIPVHIRISGGLHVDSIGGSGIRYASIQRQVVLEQEGAPDIVTSTEISGRERVVQGTAFIPFAELGYDFIPPFDIPFLGSKVKYVLQVRNEQGAESIGEGVSMNIWIEPNTRETVSQLNALVRGDAAETGQSAQQVLGRDRSIRTYKCR